MIRVALIALYIIVLTSESKTQIVKIAGGFNNVVSLHATANNVIYVAEGESQRIIRVKYDGTRIDSLGGLGTGMYQFDGLNDLDASNGLKLFVVDRYNQRIQIFDRRLQYLTSLQRTETRSGSLSFEPISIAVDRMDQAYFFDDLSRTVFKFNFRGEFDKQIYVNEIEGDIEDVNMKIVENKLSISVEKSKEIYNYSVDGKYINFITLDFKILDFAFTDFGYLIATDSEILSVDFVGRRLKSVALPKSVKNASITANGENVFVSDGAQLFKITGLLPR